MEPDTARRLTDARVGHLATVTPDGRPHVVVCCFALLDLRSPPSGELVGSTVCTAVDAKPKAGPVLQRLRNIEAHHHAALVVDHYEEDWDRLWWIRVEGTARIVADGAGYERARRALGDKYRQYRTAPPPGPAILLQVERVVAWP